MKNKKLLYGVTCSFGSMMVGFFAKDLDKIYGSILFAIGIIIMVISIVKINR